MDTDSSIEYIAQDDTIESYNLRVTGSTLGEDGDGTNIESNEIIAGSRPSGINKGIGAEGFTRTRLGYEFNYNSQGYHQIIEIDVDNETETVIFENITDSGGENIFPLNPQFYVNDIKLINGNFLVFTDNNMPPCYISLERLKDGSFGVLTEDDFMLIKAQPKQLPTAVYNDDASRSVNLLRNNLFQPRYQYIYLDDEYSAWSSMGKRPVPELETTPAVGTDVSIANNLIISVDAGTNRVKTLNIAARIGLLDFFLIKSINRVDVIALPDTEVDVENQIYEAYDPTTNVYSFAFYNDGLYVNIDPLETDLDYDHVPLTAGSLEVINGAILTLADLVEGYVRPTTDVTLDVIYYDAGVTINPAPGSDPLAASWTNTRTGAPFIYFRVKVYFTGIVQTGDIITIITANSDNVDYTPSTSYTVPVSQDGDTEAAIRSLATSMPYPTSVSVSGSTVILDFSTRRINETPDGKFEYLRLVDIDLANAGTGDSLSKPVLKTNSSYQVALAYYDKYGRYFPIQTDGTYIQKTQSFSQVTGLTPAITWQINDLAAPTGAASYQWLLSLNNTHQTTLWMIAVLVVADSNSDYFVFNLNALLNFNTNNSSSVLTYDYTVGDRVTFVYKKEGSVITYYDKIDVEVAGFEIDVTDDDPPETNYLLKVRKPPNDVLSIADLTNKNVLLEIYTPRKRTTTSSTGEVSYTEQVFYEIGEQFEIVNGEHSVLSGEIRQGDVYLKTRQLENQIDDTLSTYTVEDFNFSDFYPSQFTSYGRPRTYDDVRGVTHKLASMRYSDTFLEGSKVNGITRFFTERIYGDAPGQSSSNYGAINKIIQIDNYLWCIQDTKAGSIPVNISIVEDQIAQNNVAVSDRLLNFIRYSDSGEYGMGGCKESFAQRPDGTLYYVDPNNSLPIRIGRDGTKPIPGKMSKFFRRTLQAAKAAGLKIIGFYDVFNDEYVIAIEQLGDVVTFFPFDAANWRFLEEYTVDPGDITITTSPTKGNVTYDDTTGIATYTSDAGESGSDNFIQTFDVDGTPTTKRTCITIIPGDSDIDPFYFGALTGQELSTLLESNPVLISGINIPVAISITGGQYSINGGAYTSSPGTVVNLDNVTVRQTSSGSYETTTTATLTVSGYSADFDVTTKDQSPDPFTFVDVTGAALSTLYTSNTVTITGITGSIPISISAGEYRINAGSWVTAPGTVVNGNTVTVRITSSGSYLTAVNATLTVGSYSDTYTVTTINNVGNEEQSGTFQKNDCAPGSSGTYATYIVAADTYFAPTLAEANALAQDDVDDNGQDYANDSMESGTTCLLDTVNALLTVDMFNDATLDVCAYIDTPGVTESNQIAARNGLNFLLSTDPAENAYILASDNMTVTTKRRFIFNIGKLIAQYPDDVAIPEFIFKVRGRSGTAGLKTGVYQEEFPTETLVMTGSPGTYVPSTVPGGGPAPIGWSSNVAGGGDGTVGIGVGNVILTFTYDRATNAISIITV